MKTRIIFAIFLLFVFSPYLIFGQEDNITTIQSRVIINADKYEICKGETVKLSIKNFFAAGLNDFTNGEYTLNCDEDCECNWSCEVLNQPNPRIEGQNIKNHSSPPIAFCVLNPDDPVIPYTVTCEATPTETTTYTISYESKEIRKAHDFPNCYLVGKSDNYVTIYKYYGEVEIIVNELKPNSCNDEDITYVDCRLEGNTNTKDYHHYTISNIVCDLDSDNCTLDNVWKHLKSNIDYQAPIAQDFVDEGEKPEIIVERDLNNPYGFPFSLPSKQVEDCLNIEIPAVNSRVFVTGLTLIPYVKLNIVDPVILQVDEENKCITNYTQEGHILYPGKVKRCVKELGSRVKIVTEGTGFHFFGDNSLGGFFGDKNKEIGKKAFNNVDKRFIDSFRKKFDNL